MKWDQRFGQQPSFQIAKLQTFILLRADSCCDWLTSGDLNSPGLWEEEHNQRAGYDENWEAQTDYQTDDQAGGEEVQLGLVGHAEVRPRPDVGDGELPADTEAELGGYEGGVGDIGVQAVARRVDLQLHLVSVKTSLAEKMLSKHCWQHSITVWGKY